jgi:uncharacterized protein
MLYLRDRAATPWPNGAGSTKQVAISPAGATTSDFDWRVSIATIDTESSFSRFDGVDRWLMPLGANGMTLRVEGETTRLASREAFAFSGESTIGAIKVRETSLDLNLMVRRDTAHGSLLAVTARGETEIAAAVGEAVILIVLEGAPSVSDNKLGMLDAVELSSASSVVVSGSAVLAIARVSPKS